MREVWFDGPPWGWEKFAQETVAFVRFSSTVSCLTRHKTKFKEGAPVAWGLAVDRGMGHGRVHHLKFELLKCLKANKG